MREGKIIFYVFFVAPMMFIAFYFGSMMVEPEVNIGCVPAQVVDLYREIERGNVIALDAGSFIEKLTLNDEEYYAHAIGETVTICNYEKKYTHLPVGWRIVQ